LLAGQTAGAETLYVTDKLRLSVYLTRDTTTEPFASLSSGDGVQVLERDGSYTLVSLPDGRSGWVRGAFLQNEEPALRRIVALEAERDRLAAELAALKADTGGRVETLDRLRDEARVAREAAAAAEDELSVVRAENRSLRDDLAATGTVVPLSWLAFAVAGALLLGGFGGWRWLDYRSRRRHGGFRIH
jgi:SH3 domain protein